MAAYTFFLNKETFYERRQLEANDNADVVVYLTGEDNRPLNTVVDGDENLERRQWVGTCGPTAPKFDRCVDICCR